MFYDLHCSNLHSKCTISAKWNKTTCSHLHEGPPGILGHTVDTSCSGDGTWCIAAPALWHPLCRQPWAYALRSWCWGLSDRHPLTLSLSPLSGLSRVSPHPRHHGPEGKQRNNLDHWQASLAGQLLHFLYVTVQQHINKLARNIKIRQFVLYTAL